jgi:hypothetical protein
LIRRRHPFTGQGFSLGGGGQSAKMAAAISLEITSRSHSGATIQQILFSVAKVRCACQFCPCSESPEYFRLVRGDWILCLDSGAPAKPGARNRQEHVPSHCIFLY